jgi:hypothetical protein
MRKILIFSISALLVLLWVGNVSADNDIVFSPTSYSANTGDTFTVDVICTPSQPIKAFEFGLDFDASLLKANYVIEGDFFEGFNTFFNDGTIDNSIGEIKDVFGLIMGQGNVSDSGSLVSISFTAKQNVGSTTLDLNGVGLTDEEGYLSVNVSDGSVSVQTSGGGGPSGGGYIPPPPLPPPNNPPEIPIKPTGPIFVELGVEYEYSSSTVDADDDLIRYKFAWGDGEVSNWSDYLPSEQSISFSHSWDEVSTYQIRVIAQDEQGENSSWSMPLNVTVSQAGLSGEPPFADFQIPENITLNKTVVFDASSSFDVDGVIVIYHWDFGDGERGNGITTSHVYNNPGEYIVSLIVTDNNGNTIKKSMVVSVDSPFKEEIDDSKGLFPMYLGFVGIIIAVGILATLGLLYRGNVKIFLSKLSSTHLIHSRNKINKINARIEKLKK